MHKIKISTDKNHTEATRWRCMHKEWHKHTEEHSGKLWFLMYMCLWVLAF